VFIKGSDLWNPDWRQHKATSFAMQTPAVSTSVHLVATMRKIERQAHRLHWLGSAWPGMFQQGPETGPPPGKDYHTIDYGLFESFVLKQIIEKL